MELWAWLGPTIGGGILLIVVTGLVLYSLTRKKGTGLLWDDGMKPLDAALEEGTAGERTSLLNKVLTITEARAPGPPVSSTAAYAPPPNVVKPTVVKSSSSLASEGERSQRSAKASSPPKARRGDLSLTIPDVADDTESVVRLPGSAAPPPSSGPPSSSKGPPPSPKGTPRPSAAPTARSENALRSFLMRMAEGVATQIILTDGTLAPVSVSIKQGQVMWSGTVKHPGRWIGGTQSIKGSIKFDEIATVKTSLTTAFAQAAQKAHIEISDSLCLSLYTDRRVVDLLFATRSDRDMIHDGFLQILNLNKRGGVRTPAGAATTGGAKK